MLDVDGILAWFAPGNNFVLMGQHLGCSTLCLLQMWLAFLGEPCDTKWPKKADLFELNSTPYTITLLYSRYNRVLLFVIYDGTCTVDDILQTTVRFKVPLVY